MAGSQAIKNKLVFQWRIPNCQEELENGPLKSGHFFLEGGTEWSLELCRPASTFRDHLHLSLKFETRNVVKELRQISLYRVKRDGGLELAGQFFNCMFGEDMFSRYRKSSNKPLGAYSFDHSK